VRQLFSVSSLVVDRRCVLGRRLRLLVGLLLLHLQERVRLQIDLLLEELFVVESAVVSSLTVVCVDIGQELSVTIEVLYRREEGKLLFFGLTNINIDFLGAELEEFCRFIYEWILIHGTCCLLCFVQCESEQFCEYL